MTSSIEKYIYGLIGYSVLKKDEKYIIVMADMHSNLPLCKSQYINISDWMISKFSKSEILLEEIERDKSELKELFPLSPHTQSLKNLYLNNMKIINPVDIRGNYIDYSWEVIGSNDMPDMTLKEYLKKINNFFCIKDDYLKKKIKLYSYDNMNASRIGEHFLIIKNTYHSYLKKNKIYMNTSIKTIKETNSNVLEEINELLSYIMEWYIIAKTVSTIKSSIIIHAGLAHTDNIIKWLNEHYEYEVVYRTGINKMNEIDIGPDNGCMLIPDNINMQFGGYYTNLKKIYNDI